MPLADIRDCIDAAIRMNERRPRLYENLNATWFSEPADHPELIELFRLCDQHGFHSARTLATNGERLAREPDLLPRLKDVGLRTVQLSFYAVGEEHDRLEGRAGAWEGKLRVAAGALQAGLAVSTQVFFRSRHGSDIARIIDAVERATDGDAVRHYVTVWMPAGRGRGLDALVPTQADFDALPPHVRALPNLGEFRPESRWVELARGGQMNSLLRDFLADRQHRGSPNAMLFVDQHCIAEVEALLDRLYADKQAAGVLDRTDELCAAPLGRWAEQVGSPRSTGMYTVISMRQEWERRISER